MIKSQDQLGFDVFYGDNGAVILKFSQMRDLVQGNSALFLQSFAWLYIYLITRWIRKAHQKMRVGYCCKARR